MFEFELCRHQFTNQAVQLNSSYKHVHMYTRMHSLFKDITIMARHPLSVSLSALQIGISIFVFHQPIRNWTIECFTHSGRSLNLSRSMLEMKVSQSNCFKILVTNTCWSAEFSIASCRNDTFHKYKKLTKINRPLILSEYKVCPSIHCYYCLCGYKLGNDSMMPIY